MKKRKGILGPLLLAFGLWCMALTVGTMPLSQGCTTSQKRVAYDTLYSSHIATDAAFSSYILLVWQGSLPTNGVPAAAQAYRDFQTVFKAALFAARWDTNSIAPPNVVEAASKVTALTKH